MTLFLSLKKKENILYSNFIIYINVYNVLIFKLHYERSLKILSINLLIKKKKKPY